VGCEIAVEQPKSRADRRKWSLRRGSQTSETPNMSARYQPTSIGEEEKKYPCAMTKLLEQALEAVRRLPPENQDEIARAMLILAGEEGEPEPIDPAHLPDVLESLAQAKRRQFATDAEVEAAFRRFDP
jgi:hypothetical protein